jgi:hypothetical protein
MAIDTGPALLRKTVHFPHGLILVLTSAMLVSCGGGPSRHLIALTVQPTGVDASVPGGTVHFSATGTYDREPITQENVPAQWDSQDPSTATIDLSTGTATCLKAAVGVLITATAAGEGGPIRDSAVLNCITPPSQLIGHCLIDPSTNTMTGNCVAGQADRCYVVEDLTNCPPGQQAMSPDFDHSCASPAVYQSDLSSSCIP